MEKDDTGRGTKVKTKTEKLKREAKGLNRQHELTVNKRTREEAKILNPGKEQEKIVSISFHPEKVFNFSSVFPFPVSSPISS